ncbi:MAG: VTT domain-containing protein [Lachnospiraceae bacterium]|nr:VTT domain-containing protein [Lachnospiraceae bacterium]
MDKTRKQKIKERIIIFSVALVVIGLLVFFLSDVFFPFIRLEAAHDFEGAKNLLISRRVVGFITVSLIEALQMVVIFIPAEFIQLTSGMSYPWWLAMILCDVGVILGASMIYFLVNVFRFNGDILNERDKIRKYEQITKTNSVMAFMYVLFIMPIIPFGAICYYGAGKKMPFRRYIFTCATGVIPSITSSILVGAAVKTFIADSLPIWLLILIIVFAAALLFTLLAVVLRKFFFKNDASLFFIQMIEKAVVKILSLKVRFRVFGAEEVRKLEGPFLYLGEHHSRWDVAALYQIDPDRRMVGVINEYLFRVPVLGKLLQKSGQIKKKLFYPDILCVKNIMRAVKNGLPVAIFPEARLSTDGGPSYIDDSIAVLALKLQVPIVLVEIRNNYFVSPKWRKKTFHGTVETEVKQIISAEELRSMSKEELIGIIREKLSYNEFSRTISEFRSRKKAEGLEGILYLCPHCRSMYSNRTRGNTMTCSCCKKQYHIGNDYRFTDESIPTIYDYYAKIREIETETLQEIDLDVPVDVKIFKDGVKQVRTEKGVFHLDREKVSFRSSVSDLYFEYAIANLEGIAYSVNEEFELYYENELYYFYPPKEERIVCTRVALLFELLKGAIADA